MIKTLEDMLTKVKFWPKERQEHAARILEAMEQPGTDVYRLSEEEHVAVSEGLEQAKRGEFVSEDDMSAFWNRNPQ